MSGRGKQGGGLDELRRTALEKMDTQMPDPAKMSTEEISDLLEDLRIYQAELKMQNEELKRIQEDLKSQRRKYADLYDFAPVGYLSMDKTGRIVEANLSVARMLDRDRVSIIGKPFSSFMDTRSADLLYLHIRSVLSRGAQQPMELIEVDVSDGKKVFPVELSSSCHEDSGGKVSCRTSVIDLTQRKLLEEHRMESLKLESLGTLAGGIAHDFNNLLMSMFGNVSLAKSSIPAESKAYGRLTQVEGILENAKNLTHQLLTFSSGGQPVKKLISLPEVIRKSVQFTLSGSSIDAQFNLPDDLWHVQADEGQLTSVVQNLVINAVEAMPQGGEVRIRGENVTVGRGEIVGLQAGNHVKLSFEDTGIGIPKEIIPDIFNPYFTTKREGSGLGLTSAYSVISRHGGIIRAISTPWIGTTMEIHLPASSLRVEKASGMSVTPSAGGLRILVLEDDEDVRNVCLEMLRLSGHMADAVATGEEAVELYRERQPGGNPFDLLILDLTIKGGMGGLQTLEAIMAEAPDVRAVVSSGYSQDPVMAEHEKYGFKGVVPKPYNRRELEEAIDLAMR